MDVNDNAGCLDARIGLAFFASKHRSCRGAFSGGRECAEMIKAGARMIKTSRAKAVTFQSCEQLHRSFVQ